MSRCRTCGARLSRYRAEGTVHCALHEPHHITHLDYIDSVPTHRSTSLNGPDTCKHGHDLLIHGRMRDTGGGRITRSCQACNTERKRRYRARAKEAA